jgi:Fic-DOC domain mobile mystery protein B
MNAGMEQPITAGEAETLLPSLSTKAQLLEIERAGIHGARIWAMHRKTLQRADLLTVDFQRELHRRMFRRIWKGAGEFRTTAATRGWEAGRIEEGVRLFVDDADGWLRYSTYPTHESAVRLHHRLVSIRPWVTGNGRHARLMADIVVAAQGEAPLTWGALMTAAGPAREYYIRAIDAADKGDMGPLLAFARS